VQTIIACTDRYLRELCWAKPDRAAFQDKRKDKLLNRHGTLISPTLEGTSLGIGDGGVRKKSPGELLTGAFEMASPGGFEPPTPARESYAYTSI
jgi:hypothetical protein